MTALNPIPNDETSPTPRGQGVDKTAKMGWTTVDSPGVPFLAAKQDLHVDTEYQRTMVSEVRVLSICREWSWVACGSIIVAEREGTLFVIDGQHRVLAAMRRSDIQELPCLVFKSTGSEEEALAFWRANTVRGNVTPYDKLRAQLAFGDELARDAVALMDSEGYRPTNSTGVHHTVGCISAFMTAMKSSRGALKRTWPIIAQLHDGQQIKRTVFDALIYLAKFGTEDISSPQWKKRILAAGLAQIVNHIDRAKMMLSPQGAKVYARATLDVINKGVPRDKRMDIDETAADHDDE